MGDDDQQVGPLAADEGRPRPGKEELGDVVDGENDQHDQVDDVQEDAVAVGHLVPLKLEE
ncbi:MAG: hypothetical protein WKF86_05270 [Acidimicrobiales bacterium]